MRSRVKTAASILRDERGLAVATVLLLGFGLILLTSVVAFRSMVQSGMVHMDAVWEQTLAVAEAGLDEGFDRVRADENYTSGDTAPVSFEDDEAERDWVVAAADAHGSDDLVDVPNGEYVVVKPTNSEVIYSVGYSPSRSAEGRRVRVVSGEITLAWEVATWNARHALLAGGDLDFSGNPTVTNGSAVGVHTNGHITIGGTSFLDGCISASNGATVSGSYTQAAGCPVPGTQERETVPIIDVRSRWSLSQYDMCPDGRVRAGPAHPTQGGTAVSEPCTGATLATDTANTPYRGWKWTGSCCDSKLGSRWISEYDIPYDGVYYFHRGTVEVPTSQGAAGAPWQATLLIAGEGVCSNIVGGDLYVAGAPTMAPYPGTSNLLFMVGRDMEISGDPHVSGVMGIHEQLKMNGNAQVVEGAFVVENACDSTEDNIHENSWSGNATFNNSGPILTPFNAADDLPVVVAWREL